jgi:hypothetical protein
MTESMELHLGEERAVHLPSLRARGGSWTVEVGGMSSAVSVRKLWAADPYPEDDWNEEAERAARPEPDEVFMVRGANPGSATVRFVPSGGDEEPRRVEVTVRPSR